MGPYRILSIDGGGVRGVYAAVLLGRLLAGAPGFLDRVDLFAGTSTGGVLALGLARGLAPRELADVYGRNAGRIFDSSWLHDLRDLGGLTGARYDNAAFKGLLQSVLGDATLADLPRRVLVPAFDLDNQGKEGRPRRWEPKFFHNFPGSGSDGGERAIDVALRTSAAPTYFPVYQGYVDGGVVANNPGMAALAQALDPGTGGRALDELRLLSVGTGLNPTYVDRQDHDWGAGQWARLLVPLMVDGVTGVADYQCARLLGDRYHRLAPILPRPVALDAAEKAGELIADAWQVDLGPTLAWLPQRFLGASPDWSGGAEGG
jgi:patatin-like phospholipase/acyl hydrolase